MKKGYYGAASAMSAIGVIVSIVLCFVFPPLGILLLIINLCSMGSSNKKRQQAEQEEKEKAFREEILREMKK